MLDGEVGLLPRQVGRHVHLLQPGLAALPAEADQEVGAGGERIGDAVDQIAAAVTVEVHGVLEIVGRRELQAAEFAGPVADHAVDGLIAALDDAQRVEQLRAEEVGAAAVIGERGDRAEDFVVAEIGAEVALQAPEGGEHRRRHAVFLFDRSERGGMLLDLGEAVGNAAAAHHAVGKLQEGLLEHGLAVIAADDGRIEGHGRRGGGDYLLRNALRGGVLLELRKPLLVAAAIVAGGGECRSRQYGAKDCGKRDSRPFQCRFPHRLVPPICEGFRVNLPKPRARSSPMRISVKGDSCANDGLMAVP